MGGRGCLGARSVPQGVVFGTKTSFGLMAAKYFVPAVASAVAAYVFADKIQPFQAQILSTVTSWQLYALLAAVAFVKMAVGFVLVRSGFPRPLSLSQPCACLDGRQCPVLLTQSRTCFHV
jgi:hypothetical protein